MAVNSVTPTQQAEVAALYAAFWNRAPDTTGFGFWVQAYSQGEVTLEEMATDFRNAPEGILEYPLASTNVALITEVYQNVFDRAPDAGGLQFWVNALNSMTFPEVVVAMCETAMAPGNADGVLFKNKITVGLYVAVDVETDNTNVVNHAFDLVSYTQESVDAAEAWVDSQVTGATYTLTTRADIATAQLFDGNLNEFGLQTLNNNDQLTGQRAVNKLEADLISGRDGYDGYVSYTTPELLKNIQIVDVTVTPNNGGGSYYPSYQTGSTLDLRNADAVEVLVNDGSTAALTFNNVGGTLTDVAVSNTASYTTVNLAAGADLTETNLNLSNVRYGAQVSIPTAETINVTSHTLANTLTLDLADATTITVDGDAALTTTLSAATNQVTSVDASTFEGDLALTFSVQTQVLSTTDITVTSGLGDDTITMSGVTQDYTVTLGAGNDMLVDTGISANDTVTGGEGFDSLSTSWDTAQPLSSVNGINGIDELVLSDIVDTAATLTVANVDSTITTVSLEATAGALSSAAATIVGSAGEFTVNLGVSEATPGTLGAALTLTDTGTGTADILNINNLAVDSDDNTNANVFAANNVTSTGYENVVINTGAASPTAQTIGTLAIAADSTSAAVSLTAEGSSPLAITSLTSNSTGLLTVDASQLNVLTSAAGLTVSGTTLTTIGSATGTQSITGSSGQDNIDVGNWAATVIGGAGNDTLTGGTLADSIDGGADMDTINGAGGNDTLHGGAGNDTITSTDAGVVSITGGTGNDTVTLNTTLASTDTVDGGEGVDTLVVTSANITASDAIGVTNFEILNTSGDQTMTNFYSNSGWTTVLMNGSGVDITNALAAVTTLQVNTNSGGTETFDRLVDTGTDTLTVATTGTAGAISLTALTAADEESLTLNTANGASSDAGSLTIGTLTATDLTSLTLTGDHAVTITNAIVGSTGLATVNASALTAALDVDATNSTADLTFTGSAASANTFVSGSGDDNLTGGSAADSIVGNGGNDTVNLGAGSDIFAFANTGAVVGGTATIAEVNLNVGSDTVAGYIVGTDALQVSISAFGTNIGSTGALGAAQYAEATSTSALLTGLTNEGIVVIQSAANADASIYYVGTSVTASTQSIATLLQSGNATLIGTLTSVSGDLSATDFTIIA